MRRPLGVFVEVQESPFLDHPFIELREINTCSHSLRHEVYGMAAAFSACWAFSRRIDVARQLCIEEWSLPSISS